MIKEAYVSFETAKLLKEKGFDEETNWYYDSEGFCEPYSAWVNACPHDYYPMPTHQMACAWLREKHLIHIEAIRGYDHFFVGITRMLPYREYAIKNDVYDNYEEAIESALKYTLENLI